MRVGALRPSSATVAGQHARMQNNLSSKRRYDPLKHNLDEVAYSQQAPVPMVNNLTQPKNSKAVLYGSGSKSFGIGQRRRTRPQSAFRN